MRIIRQFEYKPSRDKVEGFQDLGDDGRSRASRLLVFMVRGLCNKWKLPFSYYLTKGATADQLFTIIKLKMEELINLGLSRRANVCDQATANVKAFKTLGASAELAFFKIKEEKKLRYFRRASSFKVDPEQPLDPGFSV